VDRPRPPLVSGRSTDSIPDQPAVGRVQRREQRVSGARARESSDTGKVGHQSDHLTRLAAARAHEPGASPTSPRSRTRCRRCRGADPAEQRLPGLRRPGHRVTSNSRPGAAGSARRYRKPSPVTHPVDDGLQRFGQGCAQRPSGRSPRTGDGRRSAGPLARSAPVENRRFTAGEQTYPLADPVKAFVVTDLGQSAVLRSADCQASVGLSCSTKPRLERPNPPGRAGNICREVEFSGPTSSRTRLGHVLDTRREHGLGCSWKQLRGSCPPSTCPVQISSKPQLGIHHPCRMSYSTCPSTIVEVSAVVVEQQASASVPRAFRPR